jgi:hypothetical protein
MLMPWLAELQRRNAERERADKAMTLAAHPERGDDRGGLEMGKSRFRGGRETFVGWFRSSYLAGHPHFEGGKHLQPSRRPRPGSASRQRGSEN